jgi:hypothetical protein
VSPILVRPVREQLEHDRVIRLLQVKLKRRHEVIANIGEDQSTSVKIGQMQIYPDLILTSTDRGHKLMGTVEVETSESVNHLEARSQWAHLGRARAPFHLYVPAGSVDIARRLAAENQVNVSEIWTYHTIGDQTRFTLVHRSAAETRRAAAEPKVERSPRPAAAEPRPAARPNGEAERNIKMKKGTAAIPPAAGARAAGASRTAGVAAQTKKRGVGPARRPSRTAAAPRKRAASGKASLTKASAAQKRK